MAKRIYLLYNINSANGDEIICASEDKDFVREVMGDCFIEDVMREWNWHTNTFTYTYEELVQLAKTVWEDMLEWYDEYMVIRVVEVV